MTAPRRRSRVVVIALLALASCHGGRAQLAGLERRYQQDAARIDGVAIDLHRLTITERQVLATYAAATSAWQAARSAHAEAGSQQQLAARGFERAAADFDDAERDFRIAALAVVTLAAGSIVCRGTMSTREFRADLSRKGMAMDRLEDVDHIFPRSRGGIDHPLNYQPLARSLNRSLGNKVIAKFMQAPLGFVTGMAVSALGVVGGCH